MADFRLLDHRGRSHQLSLLSSAKLVVILAQGNGCPLVQRRAPALRALRADFEDRGVAFFMLNSAAKDSRAAITAEAQAYGYDWPILEDRAQVVADALGLTRTAEVVLLDRARRAILYRGAVDDRHDYGVAPREGRDYLREAIEAALAGKAPDVSATEAKGCIIARPKRRSPVFTRDVHPILAAKCAGCHREGGAEPSRLWDYDEMRHWAPTLREVVMTGRMPPMTTDTEYGMVKGDLTLTPDELSALVRWTEGTLERGEGQPGRPPPRPPAPRPADLTFTMDRGVDLPASGPDLFEYFQLGEATTSQLWLSAVRYELDPRVVKHVHLFLTDKPLSTFSQDARRELQAYRGASLATSGPAPVVLPKGYALSVPPGTYLIAEVHFAATGRPERGRVRAHYYLAPPSSAPRPLEFAHSENFSLAIPPRGKGVEFETSHTFSRDARLLLLHHHVHLRGADVRFKALYPDGREEILLSFPFNAVNGRMYELERPKDVPAGTRVSAVVRYDNTADNPANPDPSAFVRFGRSRERDEMLKITLMYGSL